MTTGNGRLTLHVLATGSKGNCAIVEDRETGRTLMVDCGICRRDFLERTTAVQAPATAVEGVLITHAHSDHVKGLLPVLRWLRSKGPSPVLFATAGTIHEARPLAECAADGFEVVEIAPEVGLAVAGLKVMPFSTSHDAAGSVCYRVEAGSEALGYVTDTGVVTHGARQALSRCRIVALEANHDVKMLKEGPYPSWLKARIAGAGGHLSNDDAAELAAELAWPGLEQVVAMHASEVNNTYSLARSAVAAGLASVGCTAQVVAGKQGVATSVG